MMVYRIRSFVSGLILFGALAATLFSFLAVAAVVLDRMPLVIPALIVAMSLQSMKMGLPVVIHHLWVKRAAALRDLVAIVWLLAFSICATASFMFAAGPHVVHDRAASELIARKEAALKSMQRAYDWEEQEYTVSLSYEKRINQLARDIAELRTKPAETVPPPNMTGQFLGLIAVLNELLSASGLLLLRLATAHSDERLAPEPVVAPAPPIVIDAASEPVDLLPAPYSGPAFITANVQVNPSERTQFMWENVLPIGALTLLTGQPKIGKSQIAIHAAAVASSGGCWPDGAPCTPGNVLLLEVEDSRADIQMRLQAAGADLRRVAVRDREMGPLDLSTPEGMDALKQQALAMGDVRLVVISPLLAFFGRAGATDDATVRGRMAALLQWAARNHVAVLGLMHPAKNAGKSLESQFAGADGYRRAARSAYVAMIDASDPNPVEKRKRRVLCCAGINGASDDFRLFYRIDGATVGGQSTSCVTWINGLADDEVPSSAVDEPKDFIDEDFSPSNREQLRLTLRALLANGPMPGARVKAFAMANGFRSNRLLYSVADELDIERGERGGFGGSGMWSLPVGEEAAA